MNEAPGILVAIAAALGALGYLFTIIRKGVRTWDRIEALMRPTAAHVDRELSGNHGSSMKDQVEALPHVVEVLRRDLARVGEQVGVAVEVSQATSRHLDEHIAQSNEDRQKLADQGIDLDGPQEGNEDMTRYSRREWHARQATAGPGPLTPSRVEGVALHWPAMAHPIHGFENVAAALRAWQDYHMDTHGWSDIAYQEAIDQAGNVYQLRGLRTQSGANGDEDVNERFGALLLILAPGEKPTAAMVKAVRRRIQRHREIFPRSRRIVGHQDIRPEPTSCPGPAVMAAIHAGTFDPENKEKP